MLYFKCPTCKTNLANKQIPYENRMNEICANTKLSFEEMEEMKSGVLDEVGAERYCCRARIMGYVRLIDEIV